MPKIKHYHLPDYFALVLCKHFLYSGFSKIKGYNEIMLNLAPVNRYILYIAIALFLVTIVIFFTKLAALGKAVKERKTQYNHIKNGMTLTKIKGNAVKEKVSTILPVIKKAVVLVPIILAIQKAYNQQEEKGPKAYREAAMSAISKKQTMAAAKNIMKDLF